MKRIKGLKLLVATRKILQVVVEVLKYQILVFMWPLAWYLSSITKRRKTHPPTLICTADKQNRATCLFSTLYCDSNTYLQNTEMYSTLTNLPNWLLSKHHWEWHGGTQDWRCESPHILRPIMSSFDLRSPNIYGFPMFILTVRQLLP